MAADHGARASIRAKLSGKRFRKMSMFRINVLAEPIDGYPANLEDLTWPVFRRLRTR